MPSYLERYENGEHAGVWDELRDIGSDVFTDADISGDAEAVADATVRRAAANIATLTQRLSAMGYRFGGPHKVNLARGIYEGIDPPRDRETILERGGEDEWRLRPGGRRQEGDPRLPCGLAPEVPPKNELRGAARAPETPAVGHDQLRFGSALCAPET